jgi:hypothetical protein
MTIIPKEINGMEDLEAMILTSVLGIYVSLKDDLISLKQAESYLLSVETVKLFKEIKFSNQLVSLIEKGTKLNALTPYSPEYFKQLDRLINSSKRLIGNYYTEYDDSERSGIIN